MTFNITIEPTEEMYDAPINDVIIPVRVWKGRAPDGTAIHAYVLSFGVEYEIDDAALKAQLPSFMKRTRQVYAIGDFPQEKPNDV